jgi:lipopolysaccharide transport system ATP-binding protein
MTDIAIRVQNLSKCYHIYDTPRDRLKQFVAPRLQRLIWQKPKQYFREFWALKDVSCEIKKGETVGIIGRNGSGKSTLLQMICGTLNPSSGSIQTNGRIAALLELGSGFNPEFSGRENVYMNAAVLGLSNKEIDDRFDDIIAFADIGDFIEQPVKTYSSGMMVRLAFAVAINVDPEILIIDEALSVGDEFFQRKCFSRIEAIRETGATIIFVSHSAGLVVELCDRAILIDTGEKLIEGIPKQIVGRYQKLLYAPADKRKTIREEMRRVDVVLPDQHSTAIHLHEQKPSFDQNLKPTSTIEYEPCGAYIDAPQIMTLEGQQVNNLISGKKYRYLYTVRFTETVSNVSFGMLIKTISGMELGGATSDKTETNGIQIVKKDSLIFVEYQFICSLTSGLYFLNAGVLGNIDGDIKYLHRIIDAICFRVVDEPTEYSTGIVDFSCFPEIILQHTS